MSEEYPRIEMCDCSEEFPHAYIFISENVCSDYPMTSKKLGKGMIDVGEEDGLLTPEGANKLREQLDALPLPENHKRCVESISRGRQKK